MEKVHLTAEKETLLPTLYGRALDSRSVNPILGDKYADEVLRKLDYDFAKLKVPAGASVTLPIRAKHFDGWTREFLATHPDATVLHLGCGLDARVFRVDPPVTVRWFDVDHPEVIDLRRRVFPDRPGYSMIGSSVTDLRWLDGISTDLPVLVVAEGLMIYLEEKDGVALLQTITERFPSGELIFDIYSRSMVKLTRRLMTVKKTGAVLKWGFDDPHDLEKQVPRLHLETDVSFLLLPELVSRLSTTRLDRMIRDWFGRRKFYQKLVRHLRYRF
jgi:O-methyltransferase involved in polyketide biosynthesis